VEPKRFGKYRVLRKISTGGMSEVYLCLLPGEGGFRKRVALKVVHPRYACDPRFRDRFIEEARLAASLSHPNLIQVFDFGKEGAAYFLAMEYVEGFDLAHASAQARQIGLPVPPGVWRHWVEGIWSGLSHLHEKGIVHRDVSPGNVLLGRTGAVKLADFGVSRSAARADDAEDLRAGKAAYFSPERARGESATPSSDLFAAAAVSAELLLNRRLFEARGPEEVLERVRGFDGRGMEFPRTPDGVAEALRASLAADPGKRIGCAGDFLAALAASGPARATPAEIAEYWDALFPHAEEETTVSPQAAGDDPAPSMVKESPPRYGMGGKTLKIGAAAVFAALTAGGVAFWNERNAPEKPVLPPPVSVLPTGPAHQTGPASSPFPPPAEAIRRGPQSPPGNVPAVVPSPAQRLVRIETVPEGAEILLGNGETIGKTPAQLDLAIIGEREVVLFREGFERKSVPASALGKGTVLRMELEPILGTVEAIQAVPWARVYDGARFLGDTPLTDVRLPVGERRLRFVNEPLGVDRSERLVVRPGKNPKVIVRMTGEGR